ncbi:DinB family protein [Flavobacterium sp.]|uniref:DinB family protein n=1 Tax=Flavobacterium sp. TaxID=239 RepID=UPI00286D8074|nr:DinB family protein [Flavobacterium sp.]
MKTSLRLLENNRNVFLRLLESFTLEQLNVIPLGFSNNIIWNIGHVIVTQQMLIYKLSEKEVAIPEIMIDIYKNGSFPTANTSQEEVDEIKKMLFSTVENTTKDFSNPNFFAAYNSYTTKSTGFTINNALEALEFNNFHEGVHLGIIMQIKKFI